MLYDSLPFKVKSILDTVSAYDIKDQNNLNYPLLTTVVTRKKEQVKMKVHLTSCQGKFDIRGAVQCGASRGSFFEKEF